MHTELNLYFSTQTLFLSSPAQAVTVGTKKTGMIAGSNIKNGSMGVKKEGSYILGSLAAFQSHLACSAVWQDLPAELGMKNDGAVISCIIQSKERWGGGSCCHGYGPPTLTNMSAAERKGLRVKRTIRDDPQARDVVSHWRDSLETFHWAGLMLAALINTEDSPDSPYEWTQFPKCQA